MTIKLTSSGDGAFRISLRVIPGAPRDRIVGELGEALKIAIAKPPEDNAANIAVEKFLARELGLRRAQVALVAGFTSRDKVIRVSGLTRQELSARLAALTDG
jgi:uncharacterized protein (TIGR00251 family)